MAYLLISSLPSEYISIYYNIAVALVFVFLIWYCGLYKSMGPSRRSSTNDEQTLQDIQEMRLQLLATRKYLAESMRKQNTSPLLLRLAWSDVAAFEKQGKLWPYCGGANGSIRMENELNYPSNAGLHLAIAYLEPVKAKFSKVSWADLIQMGGALAVELTGGPKIHMKYGRIDADISLLTSTDYSSYQPCPCYPFPAITPTAHVRNVFFRLGFTNAETVALMGAHTIGRGFKDRTGVCENISGDQGSSNYTRQNSVARADGVSGVGVAGGKSWTKQWLRFDNSYFRRVKEETPDPDLLWLPTDDALLVCPEYRRHFLRFQGNQDTFFRAYAPAHKKFSELGAKFSPSEGMYLD
jgi:L-ascorbate peroxidase